MKTSSLRIERLIVGSMATNCYVVIDSRAQEALVIDPGDDAEYIIDKLQQYRVKPIGIVASHGHFDHILAARALQLALNAPFAIHEEDIFLLKRMQESARHFLGIITDPPPEISKKLKDKEILTVGSATLTVIHTPGHTPGSICLSLEAQNTLFVGDTIFAGGSVGRTDFSYSSQSELKTSINKILAFPTNTKFLSGHGEATVLSDEQSFHTVQ
jgi:glyoxylase-like metal-dependent hydrolase (beta-lactamase superfamily II)